ncbi:MAG: xanthine dehydrogenase molybdenum-binding subunit XdhA [Clostridium sp.]
MTNNIIGNSVIRFDAVAKVTGKAKYVDDFFVNDMLIGKVLRSPYAHAIVKNIDTSKAKSLEGVEAVITYKDLPEIKFATAGHPWSLDPSHRDIEDRLILTDKARFVGDTIAAVIAVDEIVAEKALELIEVEYEVLKHILKTEDAIKEEAPIIHNDRANNILSSFGSEIGNVEEDLKKSEKVFKGEFETSMVQHCHMENHSAYAYVDSEDRIIVVSSTQIPHIVRRIVGQSLGISWGKIKVIKPYIGGGFGNKQDVVIEPLTVAMSLAVNGRPVRYTLNREECFIDTRTRHAMKIKFKTGISKDEKLTGLDIKNLVNNGAYASHGHSVTMSAGGKFRGVYDFNSIKYSPVTVYTNLPAAGAMRGYGAPQMCFALESHIDDICKELNVDPIEFRVKNFVSEGYVEPLSKNIVRAFGLPECIEKGKELIKWDEKKKRLENKTGDKRRGVGMACFSYFSGTHPVALEPAGARIVMNQDGSVQLQIGATEIGQGSDTVFGQMVAEVLGLSIDMVHVISTQDTDITPFDTGSYASRQTFVSGAAVKKCALEIKDKVLELAICKCGLEKDELDIVNCEIVEKKLGRVVCSLEEIAMESYYDRIKCCPITSDTSVNVRVNAIAYGTTFTEVEVDIKTGKIEVLEIYNIHDSGIIMNPMLAEGQVDGGVSMALGYVLSEQMLFDEKTGKPLNNNLLDYKLQTIMDTPTINSAFIEKYEPASGFGQKSLGENTTVSPAPAIRNAVLDATGVAFNKIPMTPQVVFEKFKEVGLI